MSIADFSKTWQWFVHRRRMSAEQVKELQDAGI
jgi:hypothetical protein